MGMTPLAGWMAKEGYRICGYDDHLREPVRRLLLEAGVCVYDIILEEHVQDYSTVVYSSAIKQDHPHLIAARAHGLRILRRGEMLAEISQAKKLVAVVGSHGKTTTAGMIAHLLRSSGVEANTIVGGLFNDPDIPPFYHSSSEWLIAEVDESDGTIDRFCPEVTLLLNADWDHADQYSTEAMIDEAFRLLMVRTTSQVLLPAAGSLKNRFIETGSAAITCYQVDESVELPFGGCFNQMNAAAAMTVSRLLGADTSKDALLSFKGMARRQSVLYHTSKLSIIEDYAHHPTEIAALLDSLRQVEPQRRLVVVFQPHRYSRTKQFKAAFADSLKSADACYLLPLYAAHEVQIKGGELSDLQHAFGDVAPECLEMNLTGVCELAAALTDELTTVAFVGAGDIDSFADVFVSWILSGRQLEDAWSHYLASNVSSDCVFKRDEPLANKTTLRVGGMARFYAEPANLTDLRALLLAAKLFQLDTFCMGRGSNLLVTDEGFNGLVVRFSAAAWRRVEILSKDRIWAGAGSRLKEICGSAAKAGLAGFEFLEGIPGAVGGALRMNAGAMGSWMFDVVERVQFLDASGCFRDLPKEAFSFGYRKVEEISRGIALGAILRSPENEGEESIRSRMDSYSSSRKETQPRAPSAGCIFKNPEGNYAGKLIDIHGVKGMRVGAAEVSDVHGNFIVNTGGATAADVIELVRRVRATIQKASGYILEPEVLLVGKCWDDVLQEAEPVQKEDLHVDS